MDNKTTRLVLTLGMILGTAVLVLWTVREFRLTEGLTDDGGDSGADAGTSTDGAA